MVGMDPLVDAATFLKFQEEHTGPDHVLQKGGDAARAWLWCVPCAVSVSTAEIHYDAPAEQQASGAGFAQFLEGLRGAAAAGQPFHVRCAIDLECSHPRDLYAALKPLLERLLRAMEEG